MNLKIGIYNHDKIYYNGMVVADFAKKLRFDSTDIGRTRQDRWRGNVGLQLIFILFACLQLRF